MFVIVPLCMVFYYGLTDKSGAFTLDNILAIATAEHSKALWEALKLSVISTVICLLLAYPLALKPLFSTVTLRKICLRRSYPRYPAMNGSC